VDHVRDGPEPIPFDPARHFAALALAASRLPDLRMMIVDPIVSAVAGDSHQNAEVRRALAPLVAFAESAGCALIGITHFTKGTQGRDPLERVTGSLGFGAVARVVFGTAKLPDEEGGGRVLVRVKSNLGPDGGGFKYELRQTDLAGEHQGIVTTRVAAHGRSSPARSKWTRRPAGRARRTFCATCWPTDQCPRPTCSRTPIAMVTARAKCIARSRRLAWLPEKLECVAAGNGVCRRCR